MTLFSGTGVALVTPASRDGILYSETEKLLNSVTSGGANALIALGSTGEASTLSASQKEDFVRFVRSRSSLPLIVGAGGNDTEAAIKSCADAQKWGADGLLVVTPFYNKCTQDGAILHYKRIAEAVDLPIIVYNVPGRTGFNLLPRTMAEIATLPGIVGIKEASGNFSQMLECIRLMPDGVLCGDDAFTVAAMCHGAKGVISVAANVAPKLVSRMTSLAESGNLLSAGALQLKLLPLIEALFCEVNPIPVRGALKLLGIDVGEPRLPMTELSPSGYLKIKQAMEELKLL